MIWATGRKDLTLKGSGSSRSLRAEEKSGGHAGGGSIGEVW